MTSRVTLPACMLASVVMAVSLLSALSAVALDNKPNVVVMLADSMGYGDLGAYGSGGELRGIPMPRIDKLAGEGLRLSQFFKGRIGKTQPLIFSADETADVGVDNQTPVAEGIGIGRETRFTGKINKVTVEVKPVK